VPTAKDFVGHSLPSVEGEKAELVVCGGW